MDLLTLLGSTFLFYLKWNCLEMLKKRISNVKYVFKTINILKKHFSNVHDNKGKICNICTKKFQTQMKLNIHVKKVHGGHKNYKCESCGKSYSQAGHLKMHIHTIHEGHKDYKCESCGKSYSQAGTLKQHIHTIHEATKIKDVTHVVNQFEH